LVARSLLIPTYASRCRCVRAASSVVDQSPGRSFDETLRTSLDFLANPCNLWSSERLEQKKTVLKLAFADRLSYVRNEGFRTPDLALPFKVLADLKSSNSEMARCPSE